MILLFIFFSLFSVVEGANVTCRENGELTILRQVVKMQSPSGNWSVWSNIEIIPVSEFEVGRLHILLGGDVTFGLYGSVDSSKIEVAFPNSPANHHGYNNYEIDYIVKLSCQDPLAKDPIRIPVYLKINSTEKLFVFDWKLKVTCNPQQPNPLQNLNLEMQQDGRCQKPIQMETGIMETQIYTGSKLKTRRTIPSKTRSTVIFALNTHRTYDRIYVVSNDVEILDYYPNNNISIIGLQFVVVNFKSRNSMDGNLNIFIGTDRLIVPIKVTDGLIDQLTPINNQLTGQLALRDVSIVDLERKLKGGSRKIRRNDTFFIWSQITENAELVLIFDGAGPETKVTIKSVETLGRFEKHVSREGLLSIPYDKIRSAILSENLKISVKNEISGASKTFNLRIFKIRKSENLAEKMLKIEDFQETPEIFSRNGILNFNNTESGKLVLFFNGNSTVKIEKSNGNCEKIDFSIENRQKIDKSAVFTYRANPHCESSSSGSFDVIVTTDGKSQNFSIPWEISDKILPYSESGDSGASENPKNSENPSILSAHLVQRNRWISVDSKIILEKFQPAILVVAVGNSGSSGFSVNSEFFTTKLSATSSLITVKLDPETLKVPMVQIQIKNSQKKFEFPIEIIAGLHGYLEDNFKDLQGIQVVTYGILANSTIISNTAVGLEGGHFNVSRTERGVENGLAILLEGAKQVEKRATVTSETLVFAHQVAVSHGKIIVPFDDIQNSLKTEQLKIQIGSSHGFYVQLNAPPKKSFINARRKIIN